MRLQQSHETASLLAHIQTGCRMKPPGPVGNPRSFACTGLHSLANLAAIIDCRPHSHDGLISGLASLALAGLSEISFVRHNRHTAALEQPGPDGRIGSHVSISHALLGAPVYVYPGARIGQEGFGFDMTPQGFRTIPQLGCVIIKDDVQIGADTTIDRGVLDATVISWRLLACSCKDVRQLEQPIGHQLRPHPPR